MNTSAGCSLVSEALPTPSMNFLVSQSATATTSLPVLHRACLQLLSRKDIRHHHISVVGSTKFDISEHSLNLRYGTQRPYVMNDKDMGFKTV